MSDVLVENSTSPQIKLLYECREGFRGKDVNRFGTFFHKDYRRIFHPRSLGKQPLSKDEHLEQTKELFAAPIEFEVSYAVRHLILYQAKFSYRLSSFPS